MPRISYFLGISIYMYTDEHNPPHFHIIYNEYAGLMEIKTGKVRTGKLPPKIISLVEEWRKKRIDQLLLAWEQAQNSQVFISIDPLV